MLPGVTVTIVNNGTNSTTVVVTGDGGTFTAPFLISGSYRVTVELPGFRTTVRETVDVRVGDRLQVDFTLEPASISTEITVVATAPLLDTGTATMGQVIDSKLIGEMPLGDGTAYGLARLVPGASFERSYALQRPMDNDNLRGLTISGTINSEFTIDGSSNIVSGARVGIQPPSDSIQEFKVETAVYDAQIGHTGAGNVNLALKSGTNQWHGAASFYNRDDSRSAVLYASKRLGTGVTPRDYNRFSATLSGPIFRTARSSWGRTRSCRTTRSKRSPTRCRSQRMRTRRFFRAAGDRRADLRPRHRAARQRRRHARSVPGQHHPDQSHQPDCRQRAATTFPAANQAGQADLSNNFFAEQPWTYGYNLQLTRIDHEWTSAHRTYGRFIRNFRREERFNFAGEINGVEISRGGTDRFNYNYAVGHTAVLSPSLFLDVKGSWLRFNDDLQPIGQLSPSELGYPASTLVAARRLPAHSALLDRVVESDHGRPRRHARRAAERLQHRPPPAVLQHAVHADADLGARQPHLEVRLRLAPAAPDRDQRRLAWRRLRVRRHLHAGVEHGRQSVRTGHRVVHAGHAVERRRSSSCVRNRTTRRSATASSSMTIGGSANVSRSISAFATTSSWA